jgi:hypothetical protein
MRNLRSEKLDIMLRSRPIEAMDPNLALRIVARAKSLRQIPKKLSLHPRKRIDAVKPE